MTNQEVFGELGYTLSGVNAYYKDYGTANGETIRLMPVFDQGLSNDKSFSLVAIDIMSHKRVELVPGAPAPLHEFPRECLADVSVILIRLAPDIAITAKKTVHIIVAECDTCKLHVESFIHNKGATECLRCAKVY